MVECEKIIVKEEYILFKFRVFVLFLVFFFYMVFEGLVLGLEYIELGVWSLLGILVFYKCVGGGV